VDPATLLGVISAGLGVAGIVLKHYYRPASEKRDDLRFRGEREVDRFLKQSKKDAKKRAKRREERWSRLP
jgi:hypothetical protein